MLKSNLQLDLEKKVLKLSGIHPDSSVIISNNIYPEIKIYKKLQ